MMKNENKNRDDYEIYNGGEKQGRENRLKF